ncbi:MAG: methionine--tRNA ligase subunit beta [Patescibacteria group bacterium]|nr:methionine--tRNA ligase subunit beta [Patescibacteria group bacterium]
MINYDDFSKVELKIAKVLEASRVEGSEKLLKLILDAGDKNEAGVLVKRQVIAGIGKFYKAESLIGKQIAIVANLEPRKFTIKFKTADGEPEQVILESNGMILAASDDNGIALLMPDKEINSGSSIG